MDASFDTWTILFLLAAFHGLVLGGILFFKGEGRKSSNVLLGIFLFLFSITLIDYVGYWTRYNSVYPHLIGFSDTFTFLFGPVLYLYVLSMLKPERLFRYKNLVHFIPFAVFLALKIPFYILPATEKLEVARIMTQGEGATERMLWVAALKVFHMIFYAGLIVFMVKYERFRLSLKRYSNGEDSLRWLRILAYCFAGYIGSYALYFILVMTIDFRVEHDYMVAFAMAGFIFAVGYLGHINPDMMSESELRKKYESSSLEDSQADRYLEQLLRYMEQEKPYREGNIRLNDLAEELVIPPHHLSQIINEKLGMNFFEFINTYRIEEAQQLLKDPRNKNFTILHVAFEAGFNNKTSFNKAFKEEVGVTPSEFRKAHLSKN